MFSSKIFKFFVVIACFIGGGIGSLGFAQWGGNDYCTQGDLMQQAYCVAKRKDTIIDQGNTSRAVGNAFIRGSISIDLFEWINLSSLTKQNKNKIKSNIEAVYGHLMSMGGAEEITKNEIYDIINLLGEIKSPIDGKIRKSVASELIDLVNALSGEINNTIQWAADQIKGMINDIAWHTEDIIGVSKNESLIIRITQFILTLTIVLAVTMVIINGIQYITKSANGEDPSKTRWNLFYLAIGLLLALFSVVIINLFRSVGESTLKTIGYHSTYTQEQLKLPLT